MDDSIHNLAARRSVACVAKPSALAWLSIDLPPATATGVPLATQLLDGCSESTSRLLLADWDVTGT